MKELFQFGAFYLVNGMVVVLVFKTDELVIASALGLAQVALYAPLNQAMRSVLSVVTRITAASGARLTILVARGERTEAAALFVEMFERTLTAALLLAVPMALVGSALAAEWLDRPVSPALVWALTGIMVAHIPVAVASRYLGAAGLVRSVTVVSVLEAALNLGLSLLLVRSFGLTGVALGTFVAQLLTTSWFNLRLSCRHLGLEPAAVMGSALRASLRLAWPVALLGAIVALLLHASLLPTLWGSVLLVIASVLLLVRDWFAREQAAPSAPSQPGSP